MDSPTRRSPFDLLSDPRAPLLALALAVAASAIWLIGLDSHLTFIADDWILLVKRWGSGAAVFLYPFHGSIVLAPAILYRLMRAIFGMGSALPYYVLSVSVFLASGVLLFVYLRRRLGDWLALLAAVLILFLGAAFEDLLFAFQFGFFASVTAGLGMLIALDRGDRRGDRIACALLVISLSLSSLGLAFAVGALADLALCRRPRAKRAYVALLPLALYGLWWIGWGHLAQNHVSLHNLEHLPSYVFDSAGAGITSLLGLASNDGSEPSQPHLIWGKLVLLAALALAALRVYREGRISRGFAVALGLALGFWILAGLDRSPERFPTSSRYQYSSAVFLLLIAAEALRGLRIPKLAILVAAVVTGLAIWGGITLLDREYTERWRPAADSLRSTLAAVQIAGPGARPGFPVTFPPTVTVPAHVYLSTAHEYGSPAYTEAELEARPEAERASADLTIAQAEGLALVPPSHAQRTIACQTLHASAEGAAALTLLHGGFTLTNETTAPVEVMLGRFAAASSVSLGPLSAGERAALTIPVDDSTRPWSLDLKGAGPIRLCTTAPSG